jgi:hypothetical protein
MLLAPGGGQRTVEWAVPYNTRYGRRVELVGLREPLIAAFLRSFLGQVPSFGSSARSVVVDAKGNVVGSAQSRTRVGGVLADRALRTALGTRRHGDYRRAGSDWFFTSAPVAGSPWRVVLASSQADLYASVNGTRRTVPWVVFATMVLALAAGLLLLRRVSTATAEIERRELNQRHAVEINDNVLQRLTVARYAMERGDDDVGREKLLETMREAQALINRLLGDRDVEPGELRRQAGAGEASPGAERPQDAPRTST